MGGSLTFEQIKKARVFAWHDRYYLFANDKLLRVVARYHATPAASDRAAMLVRPSALSGTEHLLDQGWHHLADCTCRYCSPGNGETSLGLAQVTKARAFAWHERHHVFASGTLLSVVTCDHPAVEATDNDLSPMLVRPSALRGTEHLLDDGWHHLEGCSCRNCSPGHDDAGLGRQARDRCRGPGT